MKEICPDLTAPSRPQPNSIVVVLLKKKKKEEGMLPSTGHVNKHIKELNNSL